MAADRARRFFLTFVRHGETELNRQGIVQGQGEDAALNEYGRRQSKALGKWLSQESYTHVYSSDLLRARETCELIMSENLLWKDNDIVLETRIRERNYGILEGRRREEYEKMAKAVGKSVATHVPEGAETIQELGNRADDFFSDLCSTLYKNSSYLTDSDNTQFESCDIPNVLVVSHGRLLATLMTRFSEKYGCVFPSGKLGVVSVNTGRSCFDVRFTKHYNPEESLSGENNGNKKIAMKCTLLSNGDHLADFA